MSATIMDGKSLAETIKNNVRCEVEKLNSRPGLAVVMAGDDSASRVYVNGKKKDCEICGIYSEEYILPAQISQEQLLDLIGELNRRSDVDGILIQHPMPDSIDEKAVVRAIAPNKDVDCFHPYNVGCMMMGETGFRPCTPAAAMRLLHEYKIPIQGKHCVVVGRSNIVGKPIALMMLAEHATVTICHTRTEDLKEQCLKADILMCAAGKAGLITGDMIKEGAVVIDIAMNRNESGKLCGDVVYEEAREKASFITPVPGGVGPVTRAMLMENTLMAARRNGK